MQPGGQGRVTAELVTPLECPGDRLGEQILSGILVARKRPGIAQQTWQGVDEFLVVHPHIL